MKIGKPLIDICIFSKHFDSVNSVDVKAQTFQSSISRPYSGLQNDRLRASRLPPTTKSHQSLLVNTTASNRRSQDNEKSALLIRVRDYRLRSHRSKYRPQTSHRAARCLHSYARSPLSIIWCNWPEWWPLSLRSVCRLCVSPGAIRRRKRAENGDT